MIIKAALLKAQGLISRSWNSSLMTWRPGLNLSDSTTLHERTDSRYRELCHRLPNLVIEIAQLKTALVSTDTKSSDSLSLRLFVLPKQERQDKSQRQQIAARTEKKFEELQGLDKQSKAL